MDETHRDHPEVPADKYLSGTSRPISSLHSLQKQQGASAEDDRKKSTRLAAEKHLLQDE
jgi:hypothetical protein